MQKTALITGITGQDGAYLAQYLLHCGYKVYGTYRRLSTINFWRIKKLKLDINPNLILLEHDLLDLASCIRAIEISEPDEVYNLAAQSFVSVSFTQPILTGSITGLGALNMLEAVRITNKKIKFYQASTSEMFGNISESPQSESTPFYPRSPYGCAKLYAHFTTVNYRESYDMHASSGILFNHESPLRGIEFVTRKIINSLCKIKLGEQDYLTLGNLDAKRDWGYALDFVKGMHMMVQSDVPDTYVLATGEAYSVREFFELSCNALDIEISWKGKDKDEVAIDTKTNKVILKIKSEYFRPAEVNHLIGDSSKARSKLGWRNETNIKQLIEIMSQSELDTLTNTKEI